jgi:hypothetical protein
MSKKSRWISISAGMGVIILDALTQWLGKLQDRLAEVAMQGDPAEPPDEETSDD